MAMHVFVSTTRRQLYTTLKYIPTLRQLIEGNPQCLFTQYLFSINPPWAVQYSTSRVKLNSSIISTVSRQLNSDIHLLTNDYTLHINSGPFDRAKICQEYGLEARHLQKIDTDLFINVPKIDIYAGKFICFSFRRHRGILKHDRCLFFVPLANTRLPESFETNDIDQWEKIIQNFNQCVQYIYEQCNQRLTIKNDCNLILESMSKTPFEFQMLEIIFDSVANNFRLKTRELQENYERVQERAYNRISIDSLHKLALLKVEVDKHRRNADLAYKAVTDLLARDRDLTSMYLTDNHNMKTSDRNEAELTLEICAKKMAEVCRTIYDLEDSLQTLETTIGFVLDAVRNDILAFETRINVVTMAFGVGAFIVGVYGMNLFDGITYQPSAFYIVVGSSMCLISGLITVGMAQLLKYRRIRLHPTRKRIRF